MPNHDHESPANRANYWRAMQCVPWAGRTLSPRPDGPQRRAEARLIEDACDDLGIALTGLGSRVGEDQWRVRVEPPYSEEGAEVTGDHQYVITTLPGIVAAMKWETTGPFFNALNKRQRAGERGYN